MSSFESIAAKEGWIKSMKSLAVTCQSLLFCIFSNNSLWSSWLYGLLHACLPADCSKYADEYLAQTVASSSLILWFYMPKPLGRKTVKLLKQNPNEVHHTQTLQIQLRDSRVEKCLEERSIILLHLPIIKSSGLELCQRLCFEKIQMFGCHD